MKLGVGLMQNPTDAQTILSRARLAEELGYDSLWLADHLLWPRPVEPARTCVEAWTMMTAVAAVTEKPDIGFIMLNSSFRPPALMAKMATTLDQLSRGRLIYSLGTGYYQNEYGAYGVPFLADKDERVAYQREVADVAKFLWTHPSPEQVDYSGKYVQVSKCRFSPAPYRQPHPPIWFGGESASTRALVAELGDGWIMHGHAITPTLEAFRQEYPGFDRDLTLAAMINTCIGRTHEEAVERARGLTLSGRETFEDMVENSLVGTVDFCRERLAAIAEKGIDVVILAVDGEETMVTVAEEIMPTIGIQV
ncbi:MULTISPECIES: LLM class flavin-dependent oxidoreductase [unclassified Mycobacterium]|uniref:LLM class flavin-dependent oxidoreductase n=1 Tax=unclassified Mycobacterium TaxID=2642494 RepID=UPI0029C93CBA|nr:MULTISPECIES: LLM class flavin-dependent oxidoreductase [unclassified Mycobacterium]